MRVLVCGGREYSDLPRVIGVLNPLLEQHPDLEIIEGGATGADTLARDWAYAKSVPVQTFPANWKLYGKRAGYIRNVQMLEEGKPDMVIAFPGGPGTGMMVNLADKANVSVRIIS
jgi:YspA, cpYpsA-related SLOG family